MKKRIYILVALLITQILQANNIVVYNNNLALISEDKNINIEKGVSKYTFDNVPKNIISDSVSMILPKNVHIMEQNYKFDQLSLYNLLKYNEGKEVQYIDINKNINKGTLVSVEGSYSLISIISSKNVDMKPSSIISIPNNNIIVNGIPKDMVTKPSIVLLLNAKNNYKKQNIELRYLTTGFYWKSNYVLTIDKKDHMYLNSWIKLTNNTNIDIDNYNLTLLSGEVKQNNHNRRPERMYKSVKVSSSGMSNDMANDIKESNFSGYHLYKIPYKVNIKKQSIKQINFLNKKISKYRKKSVININNIWSYNKKRRKYLDQIITIENTKENNLGLALPKGNIRVYKADKEDNSLFIGESNINNIANTEKIKINIGKDFDTICNMYLNSIKVDKRVNDITYITYTIELDNKGDKEKTYVITVKNRYNYNRGINTSPITSNLNKNASTSTCSNIKGCYFKLEENTSEYMVQLLPNAKIIIKTTLKYNLKR